MVVTRCPPNKKVSGLCGLYLVVYYNPSGRQDNLGASITKVSVKVAVYAMARHIQSKTRIPHLTSHPMLHGGHLFADLQGFGPQKLLRHESGTWLLFAVLQRPWTWWPSKHSLALLGNRSWVLCEMNTTSSGPASNINFARSCANLIFDHGDPIAAALLAAPAQPSKGSNPLPQLLPSPATAVAIHPYSERVLLTQPCAKSSRLFHNTRYPRPRDRRLCVLSLPPRGLNGINRHWYGV